MVTDYLRQRFDQDKVYLLGHSWGSLIAIEAAARSPERYHAYLAMARTTTPAPPNWLVTTSANSTPPMKGFYEFGGSAHSPVLEEPALAHRILLGDVLAGTNALADLR